MLYNIFSEFLEDISEDVFPKDLTGYQDSLVWKKLFNFQRDAATGIINKLETYNGCILAEAVGLGKTFTALALVKYYELRNTSVLVLCPKKLADNWLTYKGNLVTNIFPKDRFGFDVLCHTDLLRERGYSPLSHVQPSRLSKYQEVYDASEEVGRGNLGQSVRENGIQALTTVNLLKRLESPVHSFRLTLKNLAENHERTWAKIAAFKKTGRAATYADVSPAFADVEPEQDDDIPDPDDELIGNKVQINLSDSLITGGKTTALMITISGLGDFELIAFVVIQNKT